MNEAILKSFSVLGPLLVVFAGLLIITRWKIGRHATVSVHAAQHKAARVILASSVILGGAMYYSLLYLLLAPRYFPSFFWMLLVIGFVCQLLLVIVPAHPTNKKLSRIHTSLGVIIALLMYIFGWLLVTHGAVQDMWAQVILWLFIIFATMAVAFLVFAHQSRKQILIFQSLYAILFWILIILLTYR